MTARDATEEFNVVSHSSIVEWYQNLETLGAQIYSTAKKIKLNSYRVLGC